MAMAEALKQTGLQSFKLDTRGTQISDQTGTAMAEALSLNLKLSSVGTTFAIPNKAAILSRNLEFRRQWRALAGISRAAAGTGFRSMQQIQFRTKLLEYFLPTNHHLQARWLTALGWVDSNQITSG